MDLDNGNGKESTSEATENSSKIDQSSTPIIDSVQVSQITIKEVAPPDNIELTATEKDPDPTEEVESLAKEKDPDLSEEVESLVTGNCPNSPKELESTIAEKCPDPPEELGPVATEKCPDPPEELGSVTTEKCPDPPEELGSVATEKCPDPPEELGSVTTEKCPDPPEELGSVATEKCPDSSKKLESAVTEKCSDSSEELESAVTEKCPDSSKELESAVTEKCSDSSEELESAVTEKCPDSSEELESAVTEKCPDSSEELESAVIEKQPDPPEETESAVVENETEHIVDDCGSVSSPVCSTVEDQSVKSPVPSSSDNVERVNSPNVLQDVETSVPPQSASPSNSDESQREISLGGDGPGEQLGEMISSNVSDEPVKQLGEGCDSNLLDLSYVELVGSGDAPEPNLPEESCEKDQKRTVESDIGDGAVSEDVHTKTEEVGSPADTKEILERDSPREQEEMEVQDILPCPSDVRVEGDVLDVNENIPDNMDESRSPCTIESGKSSEKNTDEEEGSGSCMTSIIDTSMFPKPPKDSEGSVVVANCFQLDVSSKPEGQNEFIQSDNFQISDIVDTGVDSKSFPGPSDDREDISDEEFDLESSSNMQHALGSVDSNPVASISNRPGGETFVNKSDNFSIHSSDVGDIIDLKLEDAALKSIGSSCDKVSNEDLEAVSDDELPNVPHGSDAVHKQSSSAGLLDDREEVSSSEDEELDKPQTLDATPISSEDEFPSQHEEETTTVDQDKGLGSVQQTESLTRLESLEAEPISDEEDNNIANDESVKQENSFDDGEAGEIKSPALGSPISEQGDLMLGGMEPVSADESPDTDGEIPSGDETERGGGKDNFNKKFESIDSDEEIPGDNQRPGHSLPRDKAKSNVKESSGGGKGEYMESISDEENLDCDDHGRKASKSTSAGVRSNESHSLLEKGRLPTSFNEHQVELDYEEGYAEDGAGEPKADIKEDEAKPEPKLADGEDGECEQEQGLASDKDEGELSDDDCEEGEIKEPGQRKMFVKPICRFFQRGHCTWGVSCRFLHPGVNDKGNYQMIEIPGFKPVGIHARLGVPGQYPEQQPPAQEEEELPPPPIPDVPHVETAWERGLRIAKEQRKKALERKEKEPDFEEKRLNLSVEEDRELNKENERTPRIIPKDPYYDQQAFEVDEYYKIPRDPWHTGHYENFEVRYHHQENSYSPPYREKPPSAPPPMRYTRPLSPPIDKFGRNREERPDPPERQPEPIRVSDYPPPAAKHPDEWIDPWRRSKSPKQRKPRSRSRGRRTRRSLSDSSDSSRSSRSSSGSSRSSRSGSSSSSSRSRSPEPAPPGVDRMERHERYGNDQPRSMVSVRGPEGRGEGNNYNRFANNNEFRFARGNQGYSSNYNRGGGNHGFGGGGGRNPYNPRQDSYQAGRGGGPGGYNNYRGYGHRGGGGGYNNRDPRGRYGGGRNMSPSRGGRGPTPDRPLPYTRPRPKSRSSSRSSSSRSRSRSKSSDSSRSRSSSNSSRSSSSSSSSGGSADSDHLYRDLGSPSKAGRHPAMHKKRPGIDNRKDGRNAKSNHHMSSSQSASSRHPPPPGMDGRVPHPRSPPHSRSGGGGGDPKYSQIPLPPPSSSSSNRNETKYASRNAPQPLVKAKDPLKVVGQKSNIKLTLLPKQQQQTNLGDRPNPLASPPHKRRMSERDTSPPSPPPNKRPNLSMQASSLRMAADKAAKLQMRSEKAKSPPPGSLPPPPSLSTSSSSAQRSKNPLPPTSSPQKQSAGKSRPSGGDSLGSKPATKAPSGGSAPSSNPSGAKAKKSTSSRREELLKQLKAVEDAIARKKFKMS